MNNVSSYTPHATPSDTTVNFGAFHPDRYSVRSVGQTMPNAWQTRGIARGYNRYEGGHNVRSFRDQLLDPVRWCFSSKFHTIGTAFTAIAVAALIA